MDYAGPEWRSHGSELGRRCFLQNQKVSQFREELSLLALFTTRNSDIGFLLDNQLIPGAIAQGRSRTP
ncbi:MAG TPA: hypothetical protein V6D27_09675 [Vampirovibrionales bacterium]